MRIDVEKLAAHGFKLDLPGKRRLIELGPSGALTGYFESTPDELRVRAGASPALIATNLDWDLDRLRVELTSQARLEGAQVDLVIARDQSGWHGRIGLRSAVAAALDLAFARHAQPLRLRGISLEGLELEHETGLSLRVARASIERAVLDLGAVRLSVEGIELPAGMAYDGEGLRIDSLRVRELRFTVDDVAALARPTEKKTGPGIDLTVLDQLNGRLDVDLLVDATVPIIGRRRATHEFRIPIAEGSIDFKGVERNLSLLEDAVLDFAVRDGKLCFELAVPLVETKPLVFWELAPEELLMAERNRVRLRRLRDFRVVEQNKVEPGRKSPFELRSLHFDKVALDLALRGPSLVPLAGGAVVLGGEAADAIGSLRVRGDVRYDVQGAADRTSLELDAERITAALEHVRTGTMTLDVRSLAVAALEGVTLAFEGVRPRALGGTVRGIEIEGLRAAQA